MEEEDREMKNKWKEYEEVIIQIKINKSKLERQEFLLLLFLIWRDFSFSLRIPYLKEGMAI